MVAALAAVMLLAQAAGAPAAGPERPAPASPTDGLPVLAFEQALREAAEKNPDLRVARARLAQVREAPRKVRALYLPRVTAGGAYTFNSSEQIFNFPAEYYVRDVVEKQNPEGKPDHVGTAPPWTTDNPPGFGTSYIIFPKTFVELVIQKQHQLGGQLQLDQALVAPAFFPGLEQALLGVRVADALVEGVRREILFVAAQLYVGSVALKEAHAVQQTLLAAQVAHEHDAQVRVDSGAMPRIFLLRAQIDRARAEQDVLRAKYSYLAALGTLAMLLGREADFDVRAPAEPAPPGGADLEKSALELRPDVEAARLGVDLARKGRSVAWMKYLPNLGLQARYALANVKGFSDDYDFYVVTLGLSWTLWDGGLREAELREAGARLEEATWAARSAEAKAKDEVRRARLDYESAVAGRVKAEEQAKLARENFQLVDNNFRAGVATQVEISDAGAALAGAETARVAEGLNVQLALLRLAKAAGLFDPE